MHARMEPQEKSGKLQTPGSEKPGEQMPLSHDTDFPPPVARLVAGILARGHGS